jgi:predicted  nucleic acid-binding Zn-ribbon protein
VLETSKEQSATLLQNISQEVAKINAEIKDYNTTLTQKVDGSFTNLNTAVNLNSSKLDEIYNKISREAETATAIIKEQNVKQQQYLEGKFTSIDSKLSSHSSALNAVDKKIGSSATKVNKEVATNRKLIILLIIIASMSLLFNLAKFVM